MRFLATICLTLFLANIQAQSLPLGYIEYYNNDFNQAGLPKNLLVSNPENVKVNKGKLHILSTSKDTVFVPGTVILLDQHIFGEFITEITLQTFLSPVDTASSVFIISGLRNSDNYYYLSLGRQGATFYKMYKGIVSIISTDTGFVLPDRQIVKIRITRDILNRSLKLEMKDKSTFFSDPNLVMGYVGFGATGATLAIDKLIIWAPTSINEPLKIF